ncbi:MAG: hypothetical protein BWY89_00765 [Bacteroidetes bacterium ADurb.BinA012]|nr:MAG: hypothetical protein BWY89_00765 [Bacteroidetes bacterium ADurb.BinA012]
MAHDLDIKTVFVEVNHTFLIVPLYPRVNEFIPWRALHGVHSESPGIITKPVDFRLDDVLALNILPYVQVNETQLKVGIGCTVDIVPKVVRSVNRIVITDLVSPQLREKTLTLNGLK